MANADDEIVAIIVRISAMATPEDKPPAMVVMPPDMGDSILGNRGGFFHLAIAALKAARGEEQKFEDAPWVYHNDIDWQIHGLKPDPNAHIYLPEKQTRFQQIKGAVLGYVLLFALVGLIVTGFVTFLGWIGVNIHI
jgi:hypothetical protein